MTPPMRWTDQPRGIRLLLQRMGSDWLTRGSATLLVLSSAAVPGGLDDIVPVTPARLDTPSIRLSTVRERLYNPGAFASTRGSG